MVKNIIRYNDKEYQLSTVNIDGCFETMIFPIENGVVLGREVYCCRVYSAGESQLVHKDVLYNSEKYLSSEAIAEYVVSQEEDYISINKIYIVGGYINEHGDEDTWIEKVFEDEEQAQACCEYLNLTELQTNTKYHWYEVDGFCSEDYITKLKTLKQIKT